MLRLLAGRTHEVMTGVWICSPGLCGGFTDTASVPFFPMTEEEIAEYVDSGEPMDKAGAYALQGGAGPWVTEVRGSRSNVIGLPWELTRKLLLAAGVEVPVTKEQDGMMKHGADST